MNNCNCKSYDDVDASYIGMQSNGFAADTNHHLTTDIVFHHKNQFPCET